MKTSATTILITGAAVGIRLEIARLFSQLDNKVPMIGKSADQLEAEAAKNWLKFKRCLREHWNLCRYGSSAASVEQ